MKLFNFIKCLFVLTLLALIYTHLQMRIFDLAYQGKQKEHVLWDLQETNGIISSEIQQMKSTFYLGNHLLTDQSKLTFFDNSDVIQVVTAEPLARPQAVASMAKPGRANTLLSLISGRFSLEAQAEEKD